MLAQDDDWDKVFSSAKPVSLLKDSIFASCPKNEQGSTGKRILLIRCSTHPSERPGVPGA